MAPTHSGATAPVRAQGPARYSVLEQGLGITRVGLGLKGAVGAGAPFLSHSHPVLRLLAAGASELIPERQGLNMLFPWGHEITVLTSRGSGVLTPGRSWTP